MLIYGALSGTNPKAAILISTNLKFFPISEFITTVLVELPTKLGSRQMVIASAYFPEDSNMVPPQEVRDLIKYCNTNRLQFLVGCDANADHTVWGSTDTNKRSEYLLAICTCTICTPTMC
jgi:ubiquinone biosynthesis protein COQ9